MSTPTHEIIPHSPKYDMCNNWIDAARKQGMSWDEIRSAGQSTLAAQKAFFKRSKEEMFWPDITPEIWHQLVNHKQSMCEDPTVQAVALLGSDYAAKLVDAVDMVLECDEEWENHDYPIDPGAMRANPELLATLAAYLYEYGYDGENDTVRNAISECFSRLAPDEKAAFIAACNE